MLIRDPFRDRPQKIESLITNFIKSGNPKKKGKKFGELQIRGVQVRIWWKITLGSLICVLASIYFKKSHLNHCKTEEWKIPKNKHRKSHEKNLKFRIGAGDEVELEINFWITSRGPITSHFLATSS